MSCSSTPAIPAAFQSAFAGAEPLDLTAAGGLAGLLAFHRARFGEARMEGDDDGDDDPDSGDEGDGDDDPDEDDNDVDWKARAKQAEADATRWKTSSRKHEQRAKTSRRELEEAKRTTLKPEERVLEEARTEGRAQARREAGERVIDGHLKSLHKAGRLTQDQADGLLDGVKHARFLDDDGDVDIDALDEWVDKIAPKGRSKRDSADEPKTRRGPSTRGQGRGTSTGGSTRSGGGGGKGAGVSSGRDLYAERRGAKKS